MAIPNATNGYAVDTGILERTNNQNNALRPKQVNPAKTHGELKIAIAMVSGLPDSAKAS